jgi:hypothetical protein
MKNLFLALVLANFLLLGWRLWIAPEEVDPMRLRGEVSPEATALVPAGGGPTATGGCLRLGPVGDGQVADALRSRLAELGVPSTMTTAEGQVWVGHWVQIESVASRAEADRAVGRLAQGGVPDAYVLQTTPPFSISLGVFRDRERAESVMAAARALGFQPQVTDRFRSGLQYWLTLAAPGDERLPLDALLREAGPNAGTEPAACPAGSIGAPVAIQ